MIHRLQTAQALPQEGKADEDEVNVRMNELKRARDEKERQEWEEREKAIAELEEAIKSFEDKLSELEPRIEQLYQKAENFKMQSREVYDRENEFKAKTLVWKAARYKQLAELLEGIYSAYQRRCAAIEQAVEVYRTATIEHSMSGILDQVKAESMMKSLKRDREEVERLNSTLADGRPQIWQEVNRQMEILRVECAVDMGNAMEVPGSPQVPRVGEHEKQVPSGDSLVVV